MKLLNVVVMPGTTLVFRAQDLNRWHKDPLNTPSKCKPSRREVIVGYKILHVTHKVLGTVLKNIGCKSVN